jgi:hypothetical protein
MTAARIGASDRVLASRSSAGLLRWHAHPASNGLALIPRGLAVVSSSGAGAMVIRELATDDEVTPALRTRDFRPEKRSTQFDEGAACGGNHHEEIECPNGLP